MNSNGPRGEGSGRGWGRKRKRDDARRVVSLGGLFTTLAANNERKNRPDRSQRVIFLKVSVMGAKEGRPSFATTSFGFAELSRITPDAFNYRLTM